MQNGCRAAAKVVMDEGCGEVVAGEEGGDEDEGGDSAEEEVLEEE